MRRVILSLAMAGACCAQRGGADTSTLTAQYVKTGLFLIAGGGCNTLLRLSGNGLILVDGKLPGNYKALVRQAGKLSFSDQPIKALILTDYHETHSGNTASFVEAGTRIVAQENVKEKLDPHDQAAGKGGPRWIYYAHDYTIRMGGVEAQLLHFGNARTNGDTVVYFPNLKVVAVGDIYAANPDPDFAAGGSLTGWGPVVGEILKLDFDIAVPGNGPMIGRADLEAFKVKMDTLVSRARALVGKGVPKDQLMGQLKIDDLGWRLDFKGERLDRFYAELSEKK